MKREENSKSTSNQGQDASQNQPQPRQEHEQTPHIEPEVIHIKEFLANKQAQGNQSSPSPQPQAQHNTESEKGLPGDRQHRDQCPCGPTCRCGKQCRCDKDGKSSCKQKEDCCKQAGMEKQEKEKSKDLIDFDMEPQIIQPEIKATSSQQELRKQFFNQSIGGQQRIRKCEVERKQDLTPRTASRILKQINEEQARQKKRLEEQASKQNWKKKPSQGLLEASKGTVGKQNQEEMSAGRENEGSSQ